ncbi:MULTISPECIES: hypothetical protein [unclassified Geodermatophilus]|uniref:hypothetical protein n=1 Tax=unclassified Geodermatophilus TaxID=2637632 RepID=UPI003EED3BAC
MRSRRARLPVIEREIERWTGLRTVLSALTVALAEAAEPDEDGSPPVVFDVDPVDLERIAAEALAALAVTRARVSRHTVNIGVSGRARNGKSTLLQSLSGLDDEQIPTGRGQPVTAVRSRIFHSDTARTARLTMHSTVSFCSEVVGPYFQVLGLAPEPRTVEEFARFDLPAAVSDLPAEQVDRLRPVLARLQEMQESLPSFRSLLTGEVREVGLEDLRRWVAYPATDSGVPDRRYLAVRDAVITTAFPISEVVELGLLDLPGLGEMVPKAEEHHLAGLENDVDFVVVVKRPTDTNAMWSVEDQASLDLIGRACGAAAVRDFMTILVNTGGCERVNIDALLDDIRRRLNDGVDGRNYQVWQADAAQRDAVARDVLGGVLTHLADALPRMDAAVVDRAMATCAQARQELLACTQRLLTTVRSIARPTAVEELIKRADAVQDEILVGVQDWVEELRGRTGDTYEDEEFLERVDHLCDEIRGWAMDGFGQGRTAWVERAHLDMRKAGAAAKVSTDALNGVRNEIARRFSGIDDVLLQRREEFWRGLAEALSPRLSGLLVGGTGQEALTNLARALREAPDPCPQLAHSVDVALDVRLDYRTRLLPRMRRLLDILRPEGIDPGTGNIRAPLVVPTTAAGAEDLYTEIVELARQAIYEGGRLLQEETQTMALVLLAYAEQFEDMVIRSASSNAEFRRLVDAYRDELWPEERSGPATATAKVQRVVGLLQAVVTALGGDPGIRREVAA